MTKKFSIPLILLAGVLWGCMGLFVRPLNAEGFSSWDIVFSRALITTVFMGILLLIYDRKLFKIKIRDLWCFLGTGLLSIVFFNFCYFTEITITTLSVAAILLYTAPAFVMVISAFCFKEKFTAVKFISLIMSFAGLIFVTGVIGNAGRITLKTLLIGLGAGLGYALYSIFGRAALERGYHTFAISFYTFLFASAGTLFTADIRHMAVYASGSAKNILFILLFVSVSTIIPYLTYTLGLKHTENGKAAIVASIEPVVATINGIIFFSEKPSAGTLAGIILVLGAIVICNISTGKKAV